MQQCRAIVADDRRANCEQDVMVTGESGFAGTYLLTEQIERNAIPTAPVLVFPQDNVTDLAKSVNFTWRNSTDLNGDDITYRNCVWIAGERVTFNNCDATSIQTSSSRRSIMYALLVALIACILFAVLIFMGLKQRRDLLGLVAIGSLAAIILVFYVGGAGSRTASKTVSGLESGKAYLWKVIAEDGKGGSVESETRRFTIK